MAEDDRPNGNRSRYQLLIDSIPYGFFAVDGEGRITEANPALAELLRYPLSKLLGSHFHFLVPEDEHETAERMFRETVSGAAATSEFDIWLVLGDGKRRLFHVAQRPIREGEEVVGGHGVVRDVTDERAAEERVRSSEQRLRLLLDRMPAILWTVDADLRLTSGSGRGLAAIGLGENQLVGQLLSDYLGTSDPEDPAVRAHARALNGEVATLQIAWQQRTFEVRVEPVREEGRIVGAVGAALDVTETIETRQQLAEQRAHWRRLFEAAPEAVVLLDSQDRVVESNREFERLFGYPADDARGRGINELIVPPDREGEAAALSRQVSRGQRVSVEAIRRRKDGSLLDVSILGTPVDVGGEKWVYGIYRDITEQKQLQEQLLHSQRLEAVGQLAGGIAHDFNNILTAILGHTQILIAEVSEPWVREDLREIEVAGERAAALTRHLLTFSRRQAVMPRDVDVSAIVEGMRRMMTRLIGDVQLETDLDPALPAVSMDPGQLEQVVMNLVINARDSMPSGGRVRVTASVLDPDAPPSRSQSRPRDTPHVVLEVTDTGTGMSEEERTRMFEPFFTTKEPGKGTGLGLSTVYGIVDQAGGWIDVDSEPDAGTRIRIHLPATQREAPITPSAAPAVEGAQPADGASPATAPTAAPTAPPTAAPTAAPTAGPEPAPQTAPGTEPEAVPLSSPDDPAGAESPRETVLLVDDDGAVRHVSRLILEREGYRVVLAASGTEALERARDLEPPPDLLLTDVVMPGMSGQDLAAEMQTLFPDMTVLFMSGYTESDLTTTRAVRSHFIPKPFEPSTLSRRVREALTDPL